jgi:hypothetical protein
LSFLVRGLVLIIVAGERNSAVRVFSPDSSGFSPHHASHYYAVRINKLSSMRKQVMQKERSER